MLANAGDAFLVGSDEEAFEVRIGGKSTDKVVGDGCPSVIAAKTLVGAA